MSSEFKPRGRPHSNRTSEGCDRCGKTTGKIRVRWPDGRICGICFTNATHRYGQCPLCGADRMLPGRTDAGEDTCRECAGITTNLTCDNCGREAERFRGGHCITCVLTTDLTELLRPNDPPDLRLKRLIKILTGSTRPESIYTWLRSHGGRSAALLKQIGDREIELSHQAFDDLPKTPAVEHLRAILAHNRILPPQEDRQLTMFEQWLKERLDQLSAAPEIHAPIERFARWHHLKRLRAESSATKNMNYAVRSAKQEITEAGKFLRWLLDEHGRTASSFRQMHIDEYLSEGTSTRRHIRNFIQYLKRETPGKDVQVAARLARTTPVLSQQERLDLVRKLIEADNVAVSIRIAGLIFLLYGVPIGRIAMLTIDDVEVNGKGMFLSLGRYPAPIPALLAPMFWAHIQDRGGQQTVNRDTRWLFPGVRAGAPRSPNTHLLKLRGMGVNIQGIRNTTLQSLVKEIDATSLARMLGYSKQTLSRHAGAASAPMSSYVVDKNPHFAQERSHNEPAEESQ
jgi:hypothetical protein